jgi:hypothetical protein
MPGMREANWADHGEMATTPLVRKKKPDSGFANRAKIPRPPETCSNQWSERIPPSNQQRLQPWGCEVFEFVDHRNRLLFLLTLSHAGGLGRRQGYRRPHVCCPGRGLALRSRSPWYGPPTNRRSCTNTLQIVGLFVIHEISFGVGNPEKLRKKGSQLLIWYKHTPLRERIHHTNSYAGASMARGFTGPR